MTTKFRFIIAISIIGFLAGSILLTNNILNTLEGFSLILTSPSILFTDYLSLAGLHATLLNVILTVSVNLIIIKLFKFKIDGPVLACLFTIAGFAFFGKNIFNGLPIYLGVYIYSKHRKFHMHSLLLIMLLSSGISPVVSYMMFGFDLNYFVSIPLGIIVGIVVGYVLPIINIHVLKFLGGYNLYNTGFSMGLISIVVYGILQLCGVEVTVSPTSGINDYHYELLIILIATGLILIALAFILDKKVLFKYKKILKHSGRLIADFFKIGGVAATLLNMGIMALLCVALVVVNNYHVGGPVIGAILTVVGFSAFGKHPVNSIPILIGALIAYYAFNLTGSQAYLSAIFFATALAPISMEFGVIAGIIAGFIHMVLVYNVRDFQGGFVLYNNGFVAGFVAGIFAPIFETFRKDELDE